MKGLFKGAKVIAHYNEGFYEGMVATCVQLQDGRYVIYCDTWDNAINDYIRRLCINLSNGAFIFQSLNDVIEYLSNTKSFDWEECAKQLLEEINKFISNIYEQ